MKFGVNSLRLYSLSCSSQGFLKEANGELKRIPCHVSEKRSGVETKNLDRLSSSIIDTQNERGIVIPRVLLKASPWYIKYYDAKFAKLYLKQKLLKKLVAKLFTKTNQLFILIV